MNFCMSLIRKAQVDAERSRRVLESHVYSLNGIYRMAE
jgi:hypothetical protein